MDIKIQLSDLNEIMQRNAQLNKLLQEAEETLARMQRRLPETKQYDNDAQACADMRGRILEYFGKAKTEEIPTES